MGTGYVRNDTTNNIADGGVIDAADLDGEFDAVVAAFNESTGHTHDGTGAEGAPIEVLGPAQDFIGDATALAPKTTATYALGKVGATYSNIYVDNLTVAGTAIVATPAEINNLSGVTSTTAELNLLDGVTASTAEINHLVGQDQGVATTDSPTFAGLTTTANVSFGDNDKAIFGAGNDLQISHDGNNSLIDEVGTGSLFIRGTNVNIQNIDSDPDESMINAIANGAVKLSHNGSPKIATTATGVAVTGNIVATGSVTAGDMNITGPTPVLTLTDNDVANEYTDIQNASGTTYIASRNGTANGQILFAGRGGGTLDEYARFNASGNLGIGTASPDTPLHVTGGTTPGVYDVATFSGGSSGGTGDEARIILTTNPTNGDIRGAWVSAENTSGASQAHDMLFYTNAASSVPVEAMRIDGSGNVGIGTSSPSEALSVTGNIAATGTVISNGDLTTKGTFAVNRTSAGYGAVEVGGSLGALIDLKAPFSDDYDARIIYNSGAALHITTLAAGEPILLRQGNTTQLNTSTTGVDVTGDLAVSGGVYLGGTGAANKLDDYEEGTFTPAYSAGGSSTATYDTQDGKYTKVGNLVTVNIVLKANALGAMTGVVSITGLPFASNGFGSASVGHATSLAITAGNTVTGYVSSSAISMREWDSTGGTTLITEANLTATAYVIMSATYKTTA